MLALLARHVTPDLLGLLVAVTGVLTLFSGFAELGLAPYALRTQARVGFVPATVQRINRSTTLLLFVVTVGIIGAAGMGNLLQGQLYAFVPLAFWATTEKNGRLWRNILIGNGLSRRTATVSVCTRLFGLGLFLVLLQARFNDVLLAYTLALSVPAIVANRILYYSARLHLRHESIPMNALTIVRRSLPFMINTLGVQLRNLDATLVSLVAGPTTAGLYGLPARLSSPLRMIPSAMAPVVLRHAASSDPAHIRATRHLVIAIFLVSTAGLALFTVTAPVVTVALFGEQYKGAIQPLQILCVGLIFAYAVTLLTSLLQGRGRERIVGLVAIVSNAAALPLIMAGAVVWGASGAAGGLALSFVGHAVALLSIWRNTRSV